MIAIDWVMEAKLISADAGLRDGGRGGGAKKKADALGDARPAAGLWRFLELESGLWRLLDLDRSMEVAEERRLSLRNPPECWPAACTWEFLGG